MSQTFNLHWEAFQSTLSCSFNTFRQDEDFFDVTLVSDDEVQVPAHKIILSACSRFFKSILKQNPHSNPLLYLHGVDSKNLEYILDYVYQGEVQISQKCLDSFMRVAQILQVEGLLTDQTGTANPKLDEIQVYCNEQEDTELLDLQKGGLSVVTDEGNYGKGKDTQPKQTKPKLESSNDFDTGERLTDIKKEEKPRSVSKQYYGTKRDIQETPSTAVITDMSKLNQTISQMFDKENDLYICNSCGKVAKTRENIVKHVEIHIEGLSYRCPICDKTFKTRNSLQFHKSVKRH